MTPIDTIVSIKSGDEYGGKYTGKLGIIKKFTDDRVDPVSIKFCDEENANLCALVKHNEALRKGEVNAES